MTRCECSGLSFESIAAMIEGGATSLEELAATTGCGGMCTACVPDLRAFLDRRRL